MERPSRRGALGAVALFQELGDRITNETTNELRAWMAAYVYVLLYIYQIPIYR